jgi:hypothetical protein
VYKNSRFSVRPVEHVLKDIDAVAESLERILGKPGASAPDVPRPGGNGGPPAGDVAAFHAALAWHGDGMESVFLQDANSLVIKPDNLIRILVRIRERFPWVRRVTSYARSHTVSRISQEDLSAMAGAGLNRVHIGLESGSDKVLAMVAKGTTKAQQVCAGKKAKAAGIELSEYVMPGLGGRELSREHALETADALNQINPDYIRLRTLAVPAGIPLHNMGLSGAFQQMRDVEMAEEILLFLESLDGITSMVRSDHILNLFEEVDGKYPEDKERLCGVVRSFLGLSPEKRMLYQVGRRMGVFRGVGDMAFPGRLSQAERVVDRLGITPENVDSVIQELMARFI